MNSKSQSTSLSLALLFSLLGANAAMAAEPNLITQIKNDENEVLVADPTGRTLYVFDRDQGSPSSVCTGVCAEIWPPYLIQASEASSLVAPLGSITRPGNQIQLTYDSRPIYTYAFDRKAGDDQGDGLGGVWHYIELK